MDSGRPDYRRRRVLAGLTAGLTGLAGCAGIGGSDASPDTSSSENSTDATDTTGQSSESSKGAATIPTYPYQKTGVEPLAAEPDPDAINPVLTADDVTDGDANFVADPFLFVTAEDEWHMFFEVTFDYGVIAHATSDDRGISWNYDQIVLDQGYHVSFPYVFKWEGEYYMTTEEGRQGAKVPLYRATSFPNQWTKVTDLYDPAEYDHGLTDHVLFRWEDRWWSLAADSEDNAYAYYADSLEGEWKPHKQNPVVKNRPKAARPGGRPIVNEDDILMFYQDVEPFYGESVRAYRITDLTPESFSEKEVEQSPVVDGVAKDPDQAGSLWNSLRMHHYDPWYLGEGEGWRGAVDGDGANDAKWTIGIYKVPEK